MKSFKWILNAKQRCDLEMLMVGAFAPLTGFLSQADYESVLASNRLVNGSLWPIPINLDVSDEFATQISEGDTIDLIDDGNILLARMTISNKWRPDKFLEASAVFGTLDEKHPGVYYLLNQTGNWYLGGLVEQVCLPSYYDFVEFRHTPATLKKYFLEQDYQQVVAFQTRNPMHRAHFELTLRAAEAINGHILIHPVVGVTKPGDLDYFTRVRCYQKILPYYAKRQATLSLLPLAMRMAGPKEALWHALIRKNYGCTHFIVGRDHAGPGCNAAGEPFYDPYAAQDLVQQYQAEIKIKMLPFEEMVYAKDRKQYCLINDLKPEEGALSLSGTKLRQLLSMNEPIPTWFSFPEIIKELKAAYPPKNELGFTLFFTGLSGAGKTTLAKALMVKLRCLGKHNLTLIDGDVVRPILAAELGFSKKDRDINIQRIGFVAGEVTKVGGIALCAAIAPYREAREKNRFLISQSGAYIEIYVATTLATCEQRDTKGLYAKARRGELSAFTGVNDPYEPPLNPEITIDTSVESIDECVSQIIHFLRKEGYLKSEIVELSIDYNSKAKSYDVLTS
jgi:sulfate adenylyltransferase